MAGKPPDDLLAPRVPSLGLDPNGDFWDGDPDANTPGSLDPAAWANMVTHELMGVVEMAGLTPDFADWGQMRQAIEAYFDLRMPTGYLVQADLDAHEAAANPHPQYARLASGPSFGGSLSAVQGVRSNIGPDHTAYLGCGYVDASTRGWWLNRYGPDHPTMPHETIMYLGWVNDNPYHGGAVRVLPGWGINIIPPDFTPSDAVHVSGHRIKTEADTWESAPQTIVPGGSLTLAHTLPAAPKWYSAHIVCVTANNGYAVGDETEMTDPPIVSNCPPVAIVPGPSSVFVRVTNQAFGVIHKTTGQNVSGSASDWAIIIRAGV